jgi:hypothetical protein
MLIKVYGNNLKMYFCAFIIFYLVEILFPQTGENQRLLGVFPKPYDKTLKTTDDKNKGKKGKYIFLCM